VRASPVSEGAAPVVTAEIREAHRLLVESFGVFVERFGEAQELGIDAGAAVAGSLRGFLSEEQWQGMPLPLRMMFGS
jgi:hypothetical protein